MPLDHEEYSAKARAAALNDRLAGTDAFALLDEVFSAPETGHLALVSSFGADAAVLLHMISELDRSLPVLFIDTRLLFAETLHYQQQLAQHLGLTDVRVLRARHLTLADQDRDDTLHQRDPDACCALRKTAPLSAALGGFDSWISGRKRYQSSSRAALDLFEAEQGRVKINPLADWAASELTAYIKRHDLPPHPLVAQGYPSLGCMPCTSKVQPGEDPRAGRWRGRAKEECGIHFVDGRVQRGPQETRP